ncbi:GNAT family N-acetyltransferase [Georgenia sp. H159]|uniref:GNAT family N-acetyltransferase n=1 Tax=Georgenia sp. H159 TaxID=3076115 RepID=UPI002D791E64|nr:GNAT family N-acetyltransferase [Georgenia sp. H159]
MLGRWLQPASVRVRPLREEDRSAALELCAVDPVASVLAAVQVEQLGRRRMPGAELLGLWQEGRLRALCWSGANLVPVAVDEPELVDAVAEHVRGRGRRASSIVGPAEQVLPLWDLLGPSWLPAREVRADQPSMAISGPPALDPDPRVRLSRVDELDVVVPACVAMFTEEVGYSPVASGGAYAARVHELVTTERSYVRIEDAPEGRRVVFKAEVGACALGVAQIQGVWVHPEHRGEGIAAPAMAAVVEDVRRRTAPTVSLYVNGYNAAALATYRRTGFEQVGTYATVLF